MQLFCKFVVDKLQCVFYVCSMTTTTPSIAAAETPDERAAREHRMLKRLSEIGMTMAEDLECQVLERQTLAAEDQRIAEILPRRVRAKRREVVDIFRRIAELNSEWESMPDAIETLMESERYDEDLADLPFGAVVTRISRDLGLDMDPDPWPANGAYDEDDAPADPRAAEAFLLNLQALDPMRTPPPPQAAPGVLLP